MRMRLPGCRNKLVHLGYLYLTSPMNSNCLQILGSHHGPEPGPTRATSHAGHDTARAHKVLTRWAYAHNLGGIADFLARKSPSKGIKIETSGDQIAVEVAIIVEYGVSIPEIASEIQTRVRKAITEMTGKFVSAVNISVQGIRTKLEKHEKPHENQSLDDKPEE